MIIPAVALTLFVILVAVTLMGGRLRRLLPAEQLSTESKDAVKLALGLVATMTAILLGLLISSAKSAFDTARSEVIQMAAKVALLDRVLVLYGPETADARRALRDATDEGVRRTWPAERGGTVRLDPNQQMGDAVYEAISRLAPQNEAERALKTQAANRKPYGAACGAAVAAASAGGVVGFQAIVDRAGLVACGDLLWL